MDSIKIKDNLLRRFKKYKWNLLVAILIPIMFFILLMWSIPINNSFKNTNKPNVIYDSQVLVDFGSELYYEVSNIDDKEKIYLRNSNKEIKTFNLEKHISEYKEINHFISNVDYSFNKFYVFLLSCILNVFILITFVYIFVKYINKNKISHGALITLVPSVLIANYYSFIAVLLILILEYLEDIKSKKIILVIALICFVVYSYGLISYNIDLYNEFTNLVNEADLIFESIVVPIS